MSTLDAVAKAIRGYSNEHGYMPLIWCVGPRTWRAVCRDIDRIARRTFDSSTLLGASCYVLGVRLQRIGRDE